LVIADRLALYVNDVFAAPQKFNGLQLSLATVFFAYQIYCDFSGYSDMAIGIAHMFGYKLGVNFRMPYLAKNISEFWHRWHISLSSWFRDYVYFPMGGSRVSPLYWCGNILVVFAISGLWHGANWTYVIWGLLNGAYILAGHATTGIRRRTFNKLGLNETNPVRAGTRIAITFFLTCVGWTVFRARNLDDAGYVLTHFWRNWDLSSIRTEQFMLRQMPVAIAAILLLELVQLLKGQVRLADLVPKAPLAPRWAIYAGFVFLVVLFGVFRNAQFIYFQF
jgi:D-alanyl-lipoteichoic acid acyltransferase DltB (MBOAT superfamily)